MLPDQAQRRVGPERRPPDHELVQHHAQRIQIRALVPLAALHDLRRDVSRGPAQRGVRVRPRHRRAQLQRLRRRLRDPRQPEVHHHHAAVLAQLDVGRLDVAVHHPARMRRLQRRQHAVRDPERLLQRRRAASQPRRQRLALEQLHHDEEVAVALLQRVRARHVHVRHALRQLDLAAQPRALPAVAGQRDVDELQRHRLVDQAVVRLVDRAHAARAQHGAHPIAPAQHGARRHRPLTFTTRPRGPRRIQRGPVGQLLRRRHSAAARERRGRQGVGMHVRAAPLVVPAHLQSLLLTGRP